MDVYDGPSADSKTLLYWHTFSNQQFFTTKTSTGNVIFINYTAPGGPLQFKVKLLYYLCGGYITSDMFIRSPVFNATDSLEVPLFLECKWVFEKPFNVPFGYVRFPNVRLPYCGALNVKSSQGILVTVYRSNLTGFVSSYINKSDSMFSQERDGSFEKFYSDTSSLLLPTEPPMPKSTSKSNATTIQELSICNSSIDGIAFNGTSLEVTFGILYPERLFGFRASFSYFGPIKLKRKKPKGANHWFKNYAALVLFLPLGIVLGLFIICVQMRGWCFFSKTGLLIRKSLYKGKPPASQANLLNTNANGCTTSEEVAHCATATFEEESLTMSTNLQDINLDNFTCCNPPEAHSDALLHGNTKEDDDTESVLTQPKEKRALKRVSFNIED